MRYQRTLGLDAEQLEELHARVEDILAEPWDKGTGRPKKLTLREAIMVTLMYKRQNIRNAGEEAGGPGTLYPGARVHAQVSSIRARPLRTFSDSFRAVISLYFFELSFR